MFMSQRITLITSLIALIALLMTLPVVAEDTGGDAVFTALKARIPELERDQISPSVVDGLYTLTLGYQLFYVSADGQYLVKGEVVELASNQPVDQEKLDAKRLQRLSVIANSEMLIYPTEDTKAALTVFTDITCPYCQKLHEELPALAAAGIEVRYLAFPRAGAQSEVANTMASIWCADEPLKKMDAAMQGEKIPVATCDDPVASQHAIGVEMQIRGTPAIILENGKLISGYVPANDLIPMALNAAN